jgi:sugar/nucleoside kinase (ribokinase family)
VDLEEALRTAPRCGALALTGRGPAGGQLTAADL